MIKRYKFFHAHALLKFRYIFTVQRCFSKVISFCDILRFEYLLYWNMEFGEELSMFQNKLHDFPRVDTSMQRQKLSFLRHSLPWQRNKHTRLSREKILIDIHNISKYHFLRISWSKDIRYKIAMQFFLPYRRPHPRQFSCHFTKKLPNQSSYHKC